MATHGKFLYQILKQRYFVKVFNEQKNDQVSELFIESFDLIIRYSWHQKWYYTFKNANFNLNISNNPKKNILILFSDPTLFHPLTIKNIDKNFNNIWWDSLFTYNQWKKIGLNMSFYTNIGFEINDKIPIWLINNDKCVNEKKFLHITSRELQYVKGTDIILKTLFEKFSSSDNVSLTILTNTKHTKNDFIYDYQKIFENTGRNHQLNIINHKIPYSEMSSLYANHNVYINASRLETFWIPALEACLYGLDIIIPEEHGMKEYVQYLKVKKLMGNWESLPSNTWRSNKKTKCFAVDINSLYEKMKEPYGSLQDKWFNLCMIYKYYNKEVVANRIFEYIESLL